jgi:hypothetical protein
MPVGSLKKFIRRHIRVCNELVTFNTFNTSNFARESSQNSVVPVANFRAREWFEDYVVQQVHHDDEWSKEVVEKRRKDDYREYINRGLSHNKALEKIQRYYDNLITQHYSTCSVCHLTRANIVNEDSIWNFFKYVSTVCSEPTEKDLCKLSGQFAHDNYYIVFVSRHIAIIFTET